MNAEAHAPSYYAATAKGLVDRARLAGDLTCDVCVVGGGFTGLSTALHLAERGFDTVLIEAQRIAWGASGRNGGQLNTGMRKDPDTLSSMLGDTQSRQLWDMAEEAKALVKGLIAKHNIDCDLKEGHISAAWKARELPDFQSYADSLTHKYDYPHVEFLDRDQIRQHLGSEAYYGGVLDKKAAHLHPLNYALGLARAAENAGARIFEATPALEIEDKVRPSVRTPGGKITARHVVLGCNGYLGKLEPRIAGNMMPINNFILATEPLGEARAASVIRDDVAVSDSKYVVDYYRLSADKRLLFGGGETYSPNFPGDIAGFVRRHMLRVFPQLEDAKIEYAWGGTLAITMNRLPDVGRLSGDIYYAQGFSGQGVALTSLVGKLIAEAIAGTAERFDLFANIPTKPLPGGTLLRRPGLIAAMLYYSLLDKI